MNFQIHPVHRILKATLPAKHCTEARTFNWFARVAVVIRPHNWFGIKMVLKYEWPTGKLLLLLLFNVPRINMINARTSPESESRAFSKSFFFLFSAVCSMVFAGAFYATEEVCCSSRHVCSCTSNKNLIEFSLLLQNLRQNIGKYLLVYSRSKW